MKVRQSSSSVSLDRSMLPTSRGSQRQEKKRIRTGTTLATRSEVGSTVVVSLSSTMTRNKVSSIEDLLGLSASYLPRKERCYKADFVSTAVSSLMKISSSRERSGSDPARRTWRRRTIRKPDESCARESKRRQALRTVHQLLSPAHDKADRHTWRKAAFGAPSQTNFAA